MYSPDFVVTKPITLVGIGLPCDAFAVIQQGILVCGCYAYDDWYQCGKVVRLSRSSNKLVLAQPGRYRLHLFNANPSLIYIKKQAGAAAQGVYL